MMREKLFERVRNELRQKMAASPPPELVERIARASLVPDGIHPGHPVFVELVVSRSAAIAAFWDEKRRAARRRGRPSENETAFIIIAAVIKFREPDTPRRQAEFKAARWLGIQVSQVRHGIRRYRAISADYLARACDSLDFDDLRSVLLAKRDVCDRRIALIDTLQDIGRRLELGAENRPETPALNAPRCRAE